MRNHVLTLVAIAFLVSGCCQPAKDTPAPTPPPQTLQATDTPVPESPSAAPPATSLPTSEPALVSVSFINSGQSLGNGRSSSIGLGDLDADGDLDALVLSYRQSNSVWLNNGKGTFVDSEQTIGSARAAHGVALGDVDDDGDLDAFIANIGKANEVWLNDGAGTFVDSDQNLGDANSNSVLLQDVDNDGDLDAVVENWPQQHKIWSNDGTGVFVDSGWAIGEAGNGTIALGDVDADGDLDGFIDTGVTNELWLNDGKGTFAKSIENGIGGGTVALGDVDGDGDLDAFIANAAEGNAVWFNDGQGSFTDSGQSFGWSGQAVTRSQPVTFGDIDRDGDIDAFTAHHELGNKLWLNDGQGVFTDSGLGLIGSGGFNVSLGDADGDGGIDAFFANWEEPGNQLWLNKTPQVGVANPASFDYLGQTPPGSTPEVFAPGVVSTDHHEHSSPTFSPDGKEVYWSLWRRPDEGLPQVIMFTQQESGRWIEPQVAPFSGEYSDSGPVFSPDGQRLYFSSKRPYEEGGALREKPDVWYVERTDTGWSEPAPAGVALDEGGFAFSSSLTSEGALYFVGRLEGVAEEFGIYRSALMDGDYTEPQLLGEAVNSRYIDWTPFIAPDESYLIFSSHRPGERGWGDLYISFRQENGSWSEPENMGDEINTYQQERFPRVSPDGKYLFFTRSTRSGNDDVFWVSAEIIEQLKGGDE